MSEIKHNPNITLNELTIKIDISDVAIGNNIRYIKIKGYNESNT